MSDEAKVENTETETDMEISENLDAIDSYIDSVESDDDIEEYADSQVEETDAEADDDEEPQDDPQDEDTDEKDEETDSGGDDDSAAEDDSPDKETQDDPGEEAEADADVKPVLLEDLLDPEEFSDETWLACQALFSHFSEKLKESETAAKASQGVEQMQKKVDELEQFVTLKRHSEYVEKFESALAGLGSDKLLGEGGFDSLSEDQQSNRLKIDEHVQVLKAGYKESGRKMPSLNELVKMSFKAVFDSPEKPAQSKTPRKKITRPSRNSMPANSVRQMNMDAIDNFVKNSDKE